MAKIPFNVDAYTARLIGRENVSNLSGAVIELVKNTYDADASVCIVYYENSSGTLYIIDNGCGMTDDVIKRHWMTIGRSTKKDRFISSKGRVQTGAKGIGRFALDRIADCCEMLTVSRTQKWMWRVNWDAFALSDNITDVTADLDQTDMCGKDFISSVLNNEVCKVFKEYEKETCTIFRMTSLRDEWGDKVLNKIKNSLLTLIPYETRNEFKIFLFDEKTTKEDADILTEVDAFSYDYKVKFDIEENGRIRGEISRSEFDFYDRFEEIMEKAHFTIEDEAYFNGKPIIIDTSFSEIFPKRDGEIENTIGKFSGSLYFEKGGRNKEDEEKYFYKASSVKNINRDAFSGIKIYRDGFRVRPYGEINTSNYDWLLLSQRKQKSPAAPSHERGKWRVNADQMLGTIFISRLNITLPDQSNREGIVETKEFGLLKECIIKIIQFLEEDRQYVFRKLNAYYEKQNMAIMIQQEINKRAEKVKKEDRSTSEFSSERGALGLATDIQNSSYVIEVSKAKTALDHKDEVIKVLEDDNRLLRTLATTGIVTNTYVHEIKDITHKLNRKIVMAKEALEIDQNLSQGLEYIKQANIIRESLNSWFKVTIGAVSKDKRTMKKVNISSLINQVVSSWKETLRDIELNVDVKNNDIEMRCFPYDIESILSNLIANSVASFNANVVPQNIINISIEEKNGMLVIDYKDSGVGLSPAYKKNPRKILESMESDKTNEMGQTIGTGMGMWIINRTISDYNGSLDLSKNALHNQGFYITIKLLIR